MALIKCIECGKEISGFAPACPYCGCPSEYQTTSDRDIIEHEVPVHKDHGRERLKDIEFWEHILDLCMSGDCAGAMAELRKKMNMRPSESDPIIKIMRTGELPVDLIIKMLPDQAVDYQAPVAPTTKPCSACSKTISVKAEVCPHCGQRTGVIVCPKCGGTEIWFLNAAYKVASMALLGPFAINTVRNKYQCAKCKHKF